MRFDRGLCDGKRRQRARLTAREPGDGARLVDVGSLCRRLTKARTAIGTVRRHEEWNEVGQQQFRPVRLAAGEYDIALIDAIEESAYDGRHAKRAAHHRSRKSRAKREALGVRRSVHKPNGIFKDLFESKPVYILMHCSVTSATEWVYLRKLGTNDEEYGSWQKIG